MAKTGIGWWDNAVESVYNMYNDFKKNLPDNNAQTSNNETKIQTQSAAPKAASSGTRPENRNILMKKTVSRIHRFRIYKGVLLSIMQGHQTQSSE